MRPLYCALLHYPVLDRSGEQITTAVTNLDVHDLARACRSYGVAGYYVVTPISAQRELVQRIVHHWVEGAGRLRVPDRSEALEICTAIPDLTQLCTLLKERHGEPPLLWATAARACDVACVHDFDQARQLLCLDGPPVLLLFGTGHGLATEVIEASDALLPPIRLQGYNHLSVRAAAAIMLDRLIGEMRRE